MNILGRAGKAQQDGPALANEEIVHAVLVEGASDLLRLKRVKFLAVIHAARL